MENNQSINLVSSVSSNQLNKIIFSLKSDKIVVSPYLKAVPYKKNIWFENHSRQFIYKLQSLNMIHYLLLYYRTYQDDRCIEKALQLFYLWYEENYEQYKSDLTYHHYVIALRLSVVSQLLSICKTLDLCILDDVFIEVLATHTKMLADIDIYKRQHINGITQDIVLIKSSMIYNTYYINNAFNNYIEFAKERLTAQLDYFIDDEDSSYLGESLQKAYFLFIRLYDFYQFLEEESDFKMFIKRKLDHLYEFLYAFTDPFGNLLPLGDSSSQIINQALFLNYNHPFKTHYEYLFSNGMRGKKLTYINAYFKKANILIAFSSNEISNEFYKLIFSNSYYSTYHKHHDNLAFNLYYKKQLLFIDGGKYNNQDDNYYRQALMSCYAHNTICVDYQDYQIEKENLNQCGIVNVVLLDDVVFACGIHTLYEDIILKRNILFFKKQLLIIDEFEAKQSHHYEIIFNINPVLSLKTDQQKKYYGYLKGDLAFELKNVFSTTPLTTHYHYGNKNKYKGFMSQRLNQVKPSHTLIYEGKGDNALIITQISLGSIGFRLKFQQTNKKLKLRMG